LIKKRYIIIALGIVSVLLVSLFVTNVLLAQSDGEYDPWIDTNDDGIIDINDVAAMGSIYGASGTPINKTALLLELQSKIDSLNATVTTLQSDLVAEAAAREAADAALQYAFQDTIDHETAERMVADNALQIQISTLQSQMLPQGFVRAPAYDSGWVSINQGQVLTFTHNLGTTEVLVYVIGNDTTGDNGIHQMGYGDNSLLWYRLNSTTISVYRLIPEDFWTEVRVMIWKIQPPP